jgi:hypothetical protein
MRRVLDRLVEDIRLKPEERADAAGDGGAEMRQVVDPVGIERDPLERAIWIS